MNYSRRVEVVGCSVSDANVPRGTIHHKSAKRAVGKVNGSRRVRWLAAVCQMRMFHVEQSIRNHFKVLWENVTG